MHEYTKKEYIMCKHQGSGANRPFEFVEFSAENKSALLRFGAAGVYQFSLSSGQGLDLAEYWVIAEPDLEKLRQRAELQFHPGTRRPAQKPHLLRKKQPARKARELPVDPRQTTIGDA